MSQISYDNKALFLDRDGVINFDSGYTYKIEEFEFIPGIFELAHKAYNNGYKIFIITNQSGIARGYYTEEEFFNLADWVEKKFIEYGIHISKTYYCPHHPIYGIGKYLKECECRKPKPGMLLKAKEEFKIDLKESIFIGDNVTDIEAGIKAGVKMTVYYHENKHCNFATQNVKNLKEAIQFFE